MVKKISKVAAPKIQKEAKINKNYLIRINRVFGQVGGVKKMIEDNKVLIEVIVQLKAVRSAIKALEAELLEEYLSSSATDLASKNIAQKNKKIADLKRIFLRFE
ncbi:MAG: metal-sensitive transcriptional regulator [Proteobacteria bacterium]|nr:metal-sensitive transcriptional regulator [Pseudomonadota bacterium]